VATFLIALAASLSLVSLGGGFYEVSVVDPAWPKHPEIIQPQRGGISRRRFWIAAHVTFELFLLASLVSAWSDEDVRFWLLLALTSHAIMRIWSVIYFIPNALRFERESEVTESAARTWTQRSRLRLPLDIVTCAAMLTALVVAGG